MHSSTVRDFLILLAIGAILFTGGYYLVNYIADNAPDMSYELSYEQEEQMGNLFKDMMGHQYSEVEEGALSDSALHVITQRMVDALDSTHYKYSFTLLNSEEINAFTIPGGNIYVFSGLLKMAETPEEVAAVIAHEIGHAEKRHVVSKLMKELSMTAIVGILSGGDPSILTEILKSIMSNTFSRAQEEEADEFALKLLEKSGVSPKSLARFFEHLNEKDLDYDKNLEIIMTHPHNDKRIEMARRYKTGNDFKVIPFTLDWKKIQDSL